MSLVHIATYETLWWCLKMSSVHPVTATGSRGLQNSTFVIPCHHSIFKVLEGFLPWGLQAYLQASFSVSFSCPCEEIQWLGTWPQTLRSRAWPHDKCPTASAGVDSRALNLKRLCLTFPVTEGKNHCDSAKSEKQSDSCYVCTLGRNCALIHSIIAEFRNF